MKPISGDERKRRVWQRAYDIQALADEDRPWPCVDHPTCDGEVKCVWLPDSHPTRMCFDSWMCKECRAALDVALAEAEIEEESK